MFSHSEKVNEGLMHVTTWMDTENRPSDKPSRKVHLDWNHLALYIHYGYPNKGKSWEQFQKKKTGSEWKRTFLTVGQVATAEVGPWSGL